VPYPTTRKLLNPLLSPSGHADLPSLFTNLGSSYLSRFRRTGDVKDIDCALSHHQKAVESTPSGHAGLQNLFTNLGNSYACRFDCNSDLQAYLAI